MAQSLAETFEPIIKQCQALLSQVNILRYDLYDDYAILRLEGTYKHYLIRVREVRRLDGSYKYSYYVFNQAYQVVAGFDNAPDPKALQLKYGQKYSQHRLETIPHHHTSGKKALELTGEMNVINFLEWLSQNL